MKNYIIIEYISKLVKSLIFPLIYLMKNELIFLKVFLIDTTQKWRREKMKLWLSSHTHIQTKTEINMSKKIMAKNFMLLNYVHRLCIFIMYMFTLSRGML